MNPVEVVIAVTAAVILFLFGIENFSREVQAISGAAFRKTLARSTKNRFLAFLLGGGVTAVIQSSTATSVIAVGLVNAGVLSFRNSLGILFGANVGTTVTAQLVALKVTDFRPGPDSCWLRHRPVAVQMACSWTVCYLFRFGLQPQSCTPRIEMLSPS